MLWLFVFLGMMLDLLWHSEIISKCSPLVTKVCVLQNLQLMLMFPLTSLLWSFLVMLRVFWSRLVLKIVTIFELFKLFWIIVLLKLNSISFWFAIFAPIVANILAHNIAKWTLVGFCNDFVFPISLPSAVVSDSVEWSCL